MNAAPPRALLLGSRLSRVDLDRALASAESRLVQGGGGYVCFTNVHAIVTGREDPKFRASTNESYMSVADGKPVYWLARARGITDLGHVPGPDFMLAALQRHPQRGHYFYGSTPEVLERLCGVLRERIPGLIISGFESPPFRPLAPGEVEAHLGRIRASGARYVWIGLGAPKQERWMREHASKLAPALAFGVGAAFDFHSGTIRRAPPLMRRLGLEWLHRLLSEPRRLWKRYVKTNALFLWYVLSDRTRPEGRSD